MAQHSLYKIFRQLRGYFISPSLNIWKSLRTRLFNKDFPDDVSQLKDFEKAPPPELFHQAMETFQQMQLQSKFSELRNMETQPEEKSFDNILNRIQQQQKNKPTGIVRSMPVFKRIAAAAAVIIVLISCFILLKVKKDSSKDSDSSVVVNPVNNTPQDSLKNIILNTDSVVNQPANNNFFANNWEGRKTKRYTFNPKNHLSFFEATINNESLIIEDNDLMYSFANYTYKKDQRNPWDTKNGTVVTINQFTSINVSPYMSEVFSDLYKVKRSGKATFKARRAKAKINKWKKTDSKKFDLKKTNNPLDIIDLGENVF